MVSSNRKNNHEKRNQRDPRNDRDQKDQRDPHDPKDQIHQPRKHDLGAQGKDDVENHVHSKPPHTQKNQEHAEYLDPDNEVGIQNKTMSEEKNNAHQNHCETCGAKVYTAEHVSNTDGKKHCFCSQECKEK